MVSETFKHNKQASQMLFFSVGEDNDVIQVD